jgi:hypothetical protein
MFDPIFMLAALALEMLPLFGVTYWVTKRYLAGTPPVLMAWLVSITGVFAFHFIGSRFLDFAFTFSWDLSPWERFGIMAIPGLGAAGLTGLIVRLSTRPH